MVLSERRRICAYLDMVRLGWRGRYRLGNAACGESGTGRYRGAGETQVQCQRRLTGHLVIYYNGSNAFSLYIYIAVHLLYILDLILLPLRVYRIEATLRMYYMPLCGSLKYPLVCATCLSATLFLRRR